VQIEQYNSRPTRGRKGGEGKGGEEREGMGWDGGEPSPKTNPGYGPDITRYFFNKCTAVAVKTRSLKNDAR
jgi:hypothetical protein